MRNPPNLGLLSAMLLATATVGLQTTPASAFAGNRVAAIDLGFVPDTGQINRGFDEKLPASSQPRPIPNVAQVSTALAMPDSDQPAPGPQTAGADATTGSAPPAGQTQAPIGATGQTMPAKFSQRNDTLDRVPIMALPIPLSEQDRQRIFRAVMADKTSVAADADHLVPTGELDAAQALHETHPLPASVRAIPGVRQLVYLKSKNKIFLVEPATRIVVVEISA